MENFFTYLAPVFLTQILVGVLLLWLFVRDRDEVGLGTILATSLMYTVLNIFIEWFLGDYLLATTLVVQWTFFVLLAQRILSIPLPRASVTLFCYFSLLMGVRMAEMNFTSPELSEEEKLLVMGFEEVENPETKDVQKTDWVQRLEAGTISHKTYATKHWLLEYLYPPEETEKPEARPTPPPPNLVKVPALPPPPENDPGELTGMSGEEFEQLFFPPAGVDPSTPEASQPTELPLQTTFENPAFSGPGSLSINAQQMAQIVEIKNRSTDPGYPPPNYTVSAVGVGTGGRFIIVDGDMLKEGSIIYTQNAQPRGWKLYKVEPNLLFWQPLK